MFDFGKRTVDDRANVIVCNEFQKKSVKKFYDYLFLILDRIEYLFLFPIKMIGPYSLALR